MTLHNRIAVKGKGGHANIQIQFNVRITDLISATEIGIDIWQGKTIFSQTLNTKNEDHPVSGLF